MAQVTDHIVDANKMVTAVEWLIWELIDSGLFEGNVMPNSMLFKNAKQIEKEQIISAYKSDRYPCSDEDAEEYYNKTYKTQAQ